MKKSEKEAKRDEIKWGVAKRSEIQRNKVKESERRGYKRKKDDLQISKGYLSLSDKTWYSRTEKLTHDTRPISIGRRSF